MHKPSTVALRLFTFKHISPKTQIPSLGLFCEKNVLLIFINKQDEIHWHTEQFIMMKINHPLRKQFYSITVLQVYHGYWVQQCILIQKLRVIIWYNK